MNPTLLTVALPENNRAYRPLTELFAAGRKAMPDNATHTFATYPRNEQAALSLSYSVPAAEGISESWVVTVNPYTYTARAIGKRLTSTTDSPFPKTFIGFIFELHYALFLGETFGYAIVSIMAALLIISVLTGLILWWPLTGKWRRALTIKRKASAERFNFDLHKTVSILPQRSRRTSPRDIFPMTSVLTDSWKHGGSSEQHGFIFAASLRMF